LKNAITEINESFTGENIIENLVNIDSSVSNEDIIKNQNEIIANLTSNYNKKAELYNAQIDLIGHNEKLIEDYNKKLNKQLDDLTTIQEKIALKDRVIELNEELTKKQIRNKKIIIGFFVLLPFLFIPLLLIVTNGFNPFIGFGIAGIMIVGYIIYMVIIYKISENI
jgi:prefoldin subunit 5